MAESVPVRCPACHAEHAFTLPTFPCPCGAPLTVPVLRDAAPTPLRHRTWRNSWVRLRCPSCGRIDHWPHPELGCGCGALLCPPVDAVPPPGAADPSEPPEQSPDQTDESGQASARRPPFRPVTIRTGHDAVTAAAQYLRWLGFTGVAEAGDRTSSGVDLRGRGVVAQIDPSTSRTPRRAVETLWLNGLNEDADCAFFALAGYSYDARLRADELSVPLFVMDLTGTPQPVNDAADRLIGG